MALSKEPALVYRDKFDPDVVRVEWANTDGNCEITLFSGPRAEERALWFARKFYITIHAAIDPRDKS
jgi:hypothetical protein